MIALVFCDTCDMPTCDWLYYEAWAKRWVCLGCFSGDSFTPPKPRRRRR